MSDTPAAPPKRPPNRKQKSPGCRPSIEPDETVAILECELRRDLKRHGLRPRSRRAPDMIDRIGLVRAVSRFAGRSPVQAVRDALAAGWESAPSRRHRYIAAAGGNRNAMLEILAEIRDSIPTERGPYGPVAIAASASSMAPVTHVRARPARPRARSRRERRGSCRSNRAGPDDAGDGDSDPAVGQAPSRRRETETGVGR